MEHSANVFSIRRHGAITHSRAHCGDGRGAETTARTYGERNVHIAPVRVLVKNGVKLPEPEIIEFGNDQDPQAA